MQMQCGPNSSSPNHGLATKLQVKILLLSKKYCLSGRFLDFSLCHHLRTDQSKLIFHCMSLCKGTHAMEITFLHFCGYWKFRVE